MAIPRRADTHCARRRAQCCSRERACGPVRRTPAASPPGGNYRAMRLQAQEEEADPRGARLGRVPDGPDGAARGNLLIVPFKGPRRRAMRRRATSLGRNGRPFPAVEGTHPLRGTVVARQMHAERARTTWCLCRDRQLLRLPAAPESLEGTENASPVHRRSCDLPRQTPGRRLGSPNESRTMRSLRRPAMLSQCLAGNPAPEPTCTAKSDHPLELIRGGPKRRRRVIWQRPVGRVANFGRGRRISRTR